jgi:hypothetical protein
MACEAKQSLLFSYKIATIPTVALHGILSINLVQA